MGLKSEAHNVGRALITDHSCAGLTLGLERLGLHARLNHREGRRWKLHTRCARVELLMRCPVWANKETLCGFGTFASQTVRHL